MESPVARCIGPHHHFSPCSAPRFNPRLTGWIWGPEDWRWYLSYFDITFSIIAGELVCAKWARLKQSLLWRKLASCLLSEALKADSNNGPPLPSCLLSPAWRHMGCNLSPTEWVNHKSSRVIAVWNLGPTTKLSLTSEGPGFHSVLAPPRDLALWLWGLGFSGESKWSYLQESLKITPENPFSHQG